MCALGLSHITDLIKLMSVFIGSSRSNMVYYTVKGKQRNCFPKSANWLNLVRLKVENSLAC